MKILHKLISGLALAGSLLMGATAWAQQSRLIETAETVPAANQWLSPGDRLQVRVVGQPGARVTFLNGQPLTELAPALTNGKRGIYQGTYLVQPTDTLQDRPISFQLLTPDSLTATARSKNTIRFLNPSVPVLATTRGPLAYLNYGLGEDRLGGAKLGYLDSLVVLHLTGRVGDLYRVQLSRHQTAWVPQEVVRLLPPVALCRHLSPAPGAYRATRCLTTCGCPSPPACPIVPSSSPSPAD
ncbi:hypothetical protein [Hymenobacter sp. 5414T-23]|uniref:hypothetical protein n=1 Tax=Hymenobacter sp. 5414T-23 TaxID=2932252 RepID=UPI001FD57A83|nr:hypothetical protein [Hymenobacter sp. 5414T-23]UOQ80426.1 hypothetical protein MUN83_16600 [Hymenobacter sp. 5414T-23]